MATTTQLYIFVPSSLVAAGKKRENMAQSNNVAEARHCAIRK